MSGILPENDCVFNRVDMTKIVKMFGFKLSDFFFMKCRLI